LSLYDVHSYALCATKFVKNQEKLIVTASYDKKVKFFDLTSTDCYATIDFGPQIPASLDFSADGSSLAVGGSAGGISVFDLRMLGSCYSDTLLNIHPHRSTVTSVFYDGFRMLSGSSDQKIIGWDVLENERCFTIKPGNKVVCMYFDGSRVAAGLDGPKLSWYDFTKLATKDFNYLREIYARR